MSNAITVISPPIPAPMTLVPASFVADLEAAEARVTALTITDQASAQEAADLQRVLTKAGVALEKARKELKAPLLVLGSAIDEAAKGPGSRIATLTTMLKQRQVTYDNEQRRIAEEQERKRQAEIRRLEDIRLAELKRLQDIADAEARENKRIADELAAKATAPIDDLDLVDDIAPPVEKTETQKAIEAVRYAPLPVAPAIVQPKTQGLTFRTSLKVTVTDVNQLPETFVERVAKMMMLRAVYCTPWREGQPLPEVPGCKFEIDRQPVTR